MREQYTETVLVNAFYLCGAEFYADAGAVALVSFAGSADAASFAFVLIKRRTVSVGCAPRSIQ